MTLHNRIITSILLVVMTFSLVTAPVPARAAFVVPVIATVVSAVWTGVVVVGSFLGAVAATTFTAVGSIVMQIATLVWNVGTAIYSAIGGIGSALGGLFSTGNFVAFGEALGTTLTQFVSSIGAAIGSFATGVSDAVTTFFSDIGTAFDNFFTEIGLGGGTAEGGVGINPVASATEAGGTISTATVAGPTGEIIGTADIIQIAEATDRIVITATSLVPEAAVSATTLAPMIGVGSSFGLVLTQGQTVTVDIDGTPTEYTLDRYVENACTSQGCGINYWEASPVTDRIIITGTRINPAGITYDSLGAFLNSGATAAEYFGEATSQITVAAMLAFLGGNASAYYCQPIGVDVFTGGNILIHKYIDPDAVQHGGIDISNTSIAMFNGVAGHRTSAQARRMCSLVDPTAFPTCWSTSGFSSPKDNGVAKWNGSVWSAVSAQGNNNYYSSLTCSSLAAPRAELYASKTVVTAGEKVNLLWSSPYGDVRKAACTAENFTLEVFVPEHEETVQVPGCNEGGIQAATLCSELGGPKTETITVLAHYETRPLIGSNSVNPLTTTTYTYTCSNANGSTSKSVTVEVQDASIFPDLKAGLVSPTVVPVGQAVTLSTPIINEGGSPADAFTVLFQVDDNEDHSSVPAVGYGTIASLLKDETKTATVSHTFPTASPYYVRACADAYSTSPGLGVINEGSETAEQNNCGEWTLITATDSTQPELRALQGSAVTGKAGDTLTLSAVIENNGLGNTAVGFNNLLQICDNDTCTGAYYDSAEVSTAVLASGASRTLTTTKSILTEGSYLYRYCADAPPLGSGTIAELDETNNCGTWGSITISGMGGQCFDGVDNDGDGRIDSADPACTGGGPGTSESPDPTTATLTATPSTVLPGGVSVLRWSSNGTSCVGSGFNTGNAANNSTGVSVTTNSTQTYGVTCTSAHPVPGTATAQVTVRNPSLSITAAPDRVVTGQSSTITWNATEVDSCSITGPSLSVTGQAGPTVTGNRSVVITGRSTYTLACDSASGNFTDTVIVNVDPSYQQF